MSSNFVFKTMKTLLKSMKTEYIVTRHYVAVKMDLFAVEKKEKTKIIEFLAEASRSVHLQKRI